MRIYELLSRFPLPKSYLGKILLSAFVGIHLPLLGLIFYLAASSAIRPGVMVGVILSVLAATLVGVGATLYVNYALLVPVRVASKSLRDYRELGSKPDLPTHYTDQAGRLMADVQETVEQLDGVIRSLEDLSTLDPLTRLPNRTLFADRLEQSLTRSRSGTDGVEGGDGGDSRRENAGGEPAVLFVDLDGFKRVNDTLGHDLGDRLLAAVAELLKGCVRFRDSVARFGGDEFTVLLEDTSLQEAAGVAGRIVDTLQKPLTVAGQEVTTGCSVGIALARETAGQDAAHDASELLRKADVALYRAKEYGGGAYVTFEPSMDLRIKERLAVESELRRALERKELELYYQPIVNLETGKIVGFETLLRWQHLKQGLLLPDRFIQIAEESGLMVSIGHWVLRESCRQIARWREESPEAPPVSLNVNLSARQFERPELVDEVRDVVRETGLDPSALKLEITESIAMSDAPSTTDVIEGLRDLGASIVIDDFGTGYSSLGYLTRFKIDALKIDYSLSSGLEQDPKKAAVARAILTLAGSLGYQVIAEGVETPDQVEYLRELGCEFGQGNLLWEPQPAEEAMLLYRQTSG